MSINWRDVINLGSDGTIAADSLMYGSTEVDLGVNTSGYLQVQYIWDPADDASDTCGWVDPIGPNDPSPPDPPVTPDGPSPPDSPDDPRECDAEGAGASPGAGGIRALPLATPAGPFSDFNFGQGVGGCSSCGSSLPGNSGQLSLLNVRRTFLPQNQSRNSSFGRSVFSNYDMTIQIYPDSTDAIVMMDPLTGLVLAGEDSNDDGTYEFDGPSYFGSVTLKNGSGSAVNNPASLSPSNPLYMVVTRRNGWVYEFEFVDAPVYDEEPVTPMGRLTSIISPEGFETTISYKTFTTAQLEESPRRQLQIDTITDPAGNTAAFTYSSSQQSGLWAVSQISVNSGDYVLAYTYNSNELLMGVTVNSETKATYTYGTDSGWQSATISFDEVQGDKRFKDKLHLSQDYMIWEEQLVNQYADVLLGIEDGAGNDRQVIYRSSTTPGLYRVYDEGRMYEWKRGEYRKYYTSWSQSGSGFSNISGTFESTYDQHTGSTSTELLSGEPQTIVDSTGYAIDYTYDSNSNVTRKDYPDSTYELFQYNANNKETYHRDRAGYVTTTEYDSNNHIVKVGMGLQDTSGSGTPTATSEAIMKIYGYYGTSHQK